MDFKLVSENDCFIGEFTVPAAIYAVEYGKHLPVEAAENLLGRYNARPFGGFGKKQLLFASWDDKNYFFHHYQLGWNCGYNIETKQWIVTNNFSPDDDYGQALPGGHYASGFDLLFMPAAR